MLNIVIIDDEERVRFLIKGIIPWETLGMRVVDEAGNGLEGLEVCRRLNPDIILTDIRMPGMDGLALLETIKEELPESKVVIISGYDDFSYARRAIKTGAYDYILKPVDEDELIQVLEKTKESIFKEMKGKEAFCRLKKEIVKLSNKLSMEGKEENISEQPGHVAIQKAVQYIHQAYNTELTLEGIAEKVYMNPNYFSELFKQEEGKGFAEYIAGLRIQKAVELLKLPELKISEIGEMVGYMDSNYFTKVFKKRTGLTPSEYRQREKIF